MPLFVPPSHGSDHVGHLASAYLAPRNGRDNMLVDPGIN
jgi:hypothetical protein